MVFNTPFSFVLSRDGYLLLPNIIYSGLSGVKINYGVDATITSDGYYAPIMIKIGRHVQLKNSFDQYMNARRMAGYYNKISTSGRGIDKKLNAKQASESSLAVAQKIYDEFKISIEHFNEGTFPVFLIKPNGQLQEVELKYTAEETEDQFKLTELRSIVDLPCGLGSEWVFCVDGEKQSTLEAALLSTSGLDDLLALLKKIGAIKQGSWITPADFIKQNQLKEKTKKAADRIFSETIDLIIEEKNHRKEKEKK